jgi:Uma2 family endonuclease
MNLLITDPEISKMMIRRRRSRGIDQKDEVWEGVYLMAPPPDPEHQGFINRLSFVLTQVVELTGLGLVQPGVAISDRQEGWTRNFRVPDISVFLNETSAILQGTHWFGGPDFAVEVLSRHDKSREKFDFYAKVGVKELLLVNRNPWALELYRLENGRLALGGESGLKTPSILASQVVPLSYQLEAGEPRPRLLMVHSDGVQRWSV